MLKTERRTAATDVQEGAWRIQRGMRSGAEGRVGASQSVVTSDGAGVGLPLCESGRLGTNRDGGRTGKASRTPYWWLSKSRYQRQERTGKGQPRPAVGATEV